jgi:monooxygenase
MTVTAAFPGNRPDPGYTDVLIVGAGLSGIDAACQLRRRAPGLSFAILEARGASGGTWDLFRYPGVRSDSDMFTLSYPFRPWTGAKSIADGAQILRYLRETAAEAGLDRHITYHRRVRAARWSSDDARWTVTIEHAGTGERSTRSCAFLFLGSGYYRHDQGYTPSWPGLDDFAGPVVHPQHWPDDLDVTGQRVVVIGSGATAVTLVPALAATAAHVTMLQRSPSFFLSLPAADPLAGLLRKLLPPRLAYAAVRRKNIAFTSGFYRLCRRYPARMAALLRRGALRRLPAGDDVARHFTPAYRPWDQRMCLVPEGDFFAAIASGRASVVTDHIEAFTASGITLRSGARLEADVIVTATGMSLLPLGGIELTVDGEPVDLARRVAYKAMMLDGVPNLAFAIGYTNASWTLKVDLVCGYVARVLAFMAERGYASVTPQLPAEPMATSPFIDLTSGYIERGRHLLPRQGERPPWRLHQDFARDAKLFTGPVDQENLRFRPAPRGAAAGRAPSAR